MESLGPQVLYYPSSLLYTNFEMICVHFGEVLGALKNYSKKIGKLWHSCNTEYIHSIIFLSINWYEIESSLTFHLNPCSPHYFSSPSHQHPLSLSSLWCRHPSFLWQCCECCKYFLFMLLFHSADSSLLNRDWLWVRTVWWLHSCVVTLCYWRFAIWFGRGQIAGGNDILVGLAGKHVPTLGGASCFDVTMTCHAG